MPSFRRRASATDTDQVVKTSDQVVDASAAADPAQVLALAEEAEAEAAEAEAMAAAARARARAIRLRREAAAEVKDEAEEPAEEAEEPVDEASAGDEPETSSDHETAETAAAAPRGRRWGLILKVVAMTLAILLTGALLAFSGWTMFQHRKVEDQQRMNAEYTAAARQSVVTLMSLDFNKAEEDVKRIIDNATGDFKKDFENQAQDFVQVAQDSKVITDVTVTATAVESMDRDTAVVLVAATSRVTNSAGAKDEPRAWRLSVNLQREGGQIKMSKVEFVP